MKYTRSSVLSAVVEALAEPACTVERAAETLRSANFNVERCEFPPPPFHGLWLVDGRELTEAQMVSLAREMAPS